MEIHFGGKLEFGDFIAVSQGNHIDFGFYAGRGRGTLQYYSRWAVERTFDSYNDWLKMPEDQREKYWQAKRFKKGFTAKCIYKSYINAVHKSRVIRITDPEGTFTDPEELEMYNKAKSILIKIGMIKN